MDRGSVGGAVRSDVVRILELMKQHDAHKKSGHEALRTIVNTLAHQMFVDGDDWGVLEGDAHIMDLCGRKLLLKIGRAVQSLEKSFARILHIYADVKARCDHISALRDEFCNSKGCTTVPLQCGLVGSLDQLRMQAREFAEALGRDVAMRALIVEEVLQTPNVLESGMHCIASEITDGGAHDQCMRQILCEAPALVKSARSRSYSVLSRQMVAWVENPLLYEAHDELLAAIAGVDVAE